MSDRLERLVERELGECCEGDIEDRLDTLEGYTTDPDEADLAALRTLGDRTRHSIAGLLVAADRPLCVCEITPVVDVGDSAVSHALSDLHGAGLVARSKEGNWRYYRGTERAERLLAALDATGGR